MNKRNIIITFTGILLFVSLLLLGCNNILSPASLASPAGKDGMGKVTVSFSAGRAAIMPSLLDFDLYKFTFMPENGGDPLSETKSKNEAFSFSLEMGKEYTLEVKAYKDSVNEENLGAEGISSPFTVNAVTFVPVSLNGYLTEGIPGTFSYYIQFPAGTDIDCFELYLDDTVSIELKEGAEIDNVNGIISNTLNNVPAGRYLLTLLLSIGERETEDYAGVTIYSNAITFYGTESAPIIFRNSDFRPFEGEELVAKWHGFDVAGNHSYFVNDVTSGDFNGGNYDPSRAVGTRYETYMEPSGNILNDVLELKPPASHEPGEYRKYNSGIPQGSYQNWTMAMTYPLQKAGTYHVSMSVWVDKPVSVSTNLVWHNTGGQDGDGGSKAWGAQETPLNGNQLYNISFSLEVGANDEIGILTLPIGDAVIYIHALKVTDEDGLEPSSDLALNAESFTLLEGRTKTVMANKASVWSVTPAGIVTLETSDDGHSVLVTAVSPGTAVIKAVSLEEPEEHAEITVTVVDELPKKHIVISFDDGPNNQFTRSFMEVLAKYNAYATFYCTGANIYGNQQLANDMVAAGHEIGNHSFTHTTNSNLNNYDYLKRELAMTQIAIEEVIGYPATSFRAPTLTYEYELASASSHYELQYGYNLELAAGSLGLPLIDASGHQLGNYDWDSSFTPIAIFERAKSLAKDGGILLLHDSSDRALIALDLILDWLVNENNYDVLSVSQMTALKGVASLTPGRIYYDFNNGVPESQGAVVPVNGITIYRDGIVVPENGLTLSEEEETLTLSAVISPSNASLQNVYWYSDNVNVADVDKNGVVTAIGGGTAVIRASAGTTVAKVEITVEKEPVPIEGIDIITSWDDIEFPESARYVWDDPELLACIPSGAIHETVNGFKPGDGNSYDNVLKISPPSPAGYLYENGYSGSMAMIYEVPLSGRYSISMDVWVESNAEPVDLIWCECDDFYQILSLRGVEQNKWHTIKFDSNSIDANLILGFLAMDEAGELGLMGATIYIKNFKILLNLYDGRTGICVQIESTAE